jgi:hypothetical protein
MDIVNVLTVMFGNKLLDSNTIDLMIGLTQLLQTILSSCLIGMVLWFGWNVIYKISKLKGTNGG